ncbi:hypothetical protein D7231_33335 [Streptomyces klenkii]|uniref:Hydroxymethylbilane synthase n=1 Tax=Streptomyces klenkii TaxID=1420899 RepID=A0A3B0AIH7_9ACTN|nr:hypothetical protein D7231_33335 [Streptomyces klenkii]
MTLSAQVSAVDGSRHVTANASGSLRDPEKLGRRVAEELLDQGAEAILSAVRQRPPAAP